MSIEKPGREDSTSFGTGVLSEQTAKADCGCGCHHEAGEGHGEHECNCGGNCDCDCDDTAAKT